MGSTLTIGSMQVLISANVQGAIIGLKNFQSVMENSIKVAQQSVNKLAGSMSTLPIVLTSAFGGFATKLGSDFEKAITNVNSLLNASTENFQKLANDVIKSTTELGVSSRLGADGMYQIVSAGFDSAEALVVMNAAIKAGIAGLTDTETAADTITTVLNAFGKSANEAADVGGKLFQVVKDGKTTFEEIAASIGQVASIANSAGLEFEDVAAVIATLTKNGVKTAIAFTQIRAIIAGLLKPTDSAKVKLEQLFGSSVETAIRLKGFASVFQEIVNLTSKSKDSASAMAELFPNIRALAGGAVLAKNDLKGLNEELEKIRGAGADTLNEVFEIQNRTIGRSMATLKNIILNTLNKIVFDNREMIISLINGVKDWIITNLELVKSILKTALVAGGLATTLLTLGTALRIVAFGLGGLALTTRTLKLVLTPISLIIKNILSVFNLLNKGIVLILSTIKLVPVAVMAVIASLKTLGMFLTSLLSLTGLISVAVSGLRLALLAITIPLAIVVGAAVTLAGTLAGMIGGLIAIGGGFKLWNKYLRNTKSLMTNVNTVLGKVKLVAIDLTKTFRNWADTFHFFEKAEMIFDKFVVIIQNMGKGIINFISQWVDLNVLLDNAGNIFVNLQKYVETFINMLASVKFDALFSEFILRSQLAWLNFKLDFENLMGSMAIIASKGFTKIGQAMGNALSKVFTLDLDLNLNTNILETTFAALNSSIQHHLNLLIKNNNSGTVMGKKFLKDTIDVLRKESGKADKVLGELLTRDNTIITEKDITRFVWLLQAMEKQIDQQKELARSDKREDLIKKIEEAEQRRFEAMAKGDIEANRRAEENKKIKEQLNAQDNKQVTAAEILNNLTNRVNNELQDQLKIQKQISQTKEDQAGNSGVILGNAKKELQILREQLNLRRVGGNIDDTTVQKEAGITLKKIVGGNINPRDVQDTIAKFTDSINSMDELQDTFNILKNIIDALFKSAGDVDEKARAIALGKSIVTNFDRRKDQLNKEEKNARIKEGQNKREVTKLQNKLNRMLKRISDSTGISGKTLNAILSGEKSFEDLTSKQKSYLLSIQKNWDISQDMMLKLVSSQGGFLNTTKQSQIKIQETINESKKSIVVIPKTQQPVIGPPSTPIISDEENKSIGLADTLSLATTGLTQTVAALTSSLKDMMSNVINVLNEISQQIKKLSDDVFQNSQRIKSIERNLPNKNIGLGGS